MGKTQLKRPKVIASLVFASLLAANSFLLGKASSSSLVAAKTMVTLTPVGNQDHVASIASDEDEDKVTEADVQRD